MQDRLDGWRDSMIADKRLSMPGDVMERLFNSLAGDCQGRSIPGSLCIVFRSPDRILPPIPGSRWNLRRYL